MGKKNLLQEVALESKACVSGARVSRWTAGQIVQLYCAYSECRDLESVGIAILVTGKTMAERGGAVAKGQSSRIRSWPPTATKLIGAKVAADLFHGAQMAVSCGSLASESLTFQTLDFLSPAPSLRACC